jgi:peptide/nickel transport system permease protein
MHLHGLVAILLVAFAAIALSLGTVTDSAAAQSDPPHADAGPDQVVAWGTRVVLDGSNSTDDIGIANYTWTFDYGGIIYTLKGEVNNTHIFALAGVFNVTLNVTDTDGHWDTDVVMITVKEKPVDYLAEFGWLIVLISVVVVVALMVWMAATGRFKFISPTTQEKLRLALARWKKIMKEVLKNRMGLVGTIILNFFLIMAVFGPYLAPYGIDTKFEAAYMPQSPEHWMGTDIFKIDIFTELLYGARTSMIVGIFSAVIASFLGAAVGLYSGYVGGWKDEAIMRANDVVLSIPWLVLMIIVAAFLGKINLTGIILIIGLTGWSFTARMVRAQVLSLKERQYVERARCIGSSDLQIIRRHIFPNTFPLVFANTILTVAVSILSEATLSFLGLRPQGSVTWGTMLSYATSADAYHIGLHYWILVPGLCIVFIVLGFTLLGYALDDILNPKLRKR